MSCSWCLHYLFFTLSALNIVRTVPPDYCLSPLNRSDCNMAPKTVYYYYKPGSRCERETWRGCPTANKFDNEYLCSLNCIFRKRQDEQVDFDQCNIPLNQSACGTEEKIVFTFDDGYCKRMWWRGCRTYNIFDDLDQCIAACNGIPEDDLATVKTPTTQMVLKKDTLEKLNEILNEVIENEFLTTTEQETETESTTETESITTEEITTDEMTTETTTVSTNDDFEEVLNP